MNTDFLAMLQNRMDTLSKGQKLLANYILESYDKAAFQTAAVMGATVGVSESTVVRFSMELGYPGYPAMQKALQEMVLQKLTSVQRIEVADDRFSKGNILQSVLQQDIDKIRATLETVDPDDFHSAVDSIIPAGRIYILGVRSSASLARFMAYYFGFMFNNVRMVDATSPSEIFEQLVHVGVGDVLIAISYPRYSRSTIQAARYCKSCGAKVIAITDGVHSPIAQTADINLFAKMDMLSFVDSLVAPMSLINALIVAIGQKKKKELSGIFSDLEQIWDEYEVYEKGDS